MNEDTVSVTRGYRGQHMRRIMLLFFLIFGLHANPVQADISLSAPGEINAGAQVRIDIAGDVGDRDFITIVPAGTPEGKYAHYQYIRSKTRVDLPVPEEAGEYEIRYLNAAPPYVTRARQSLLVKPVQATVEVPRQVAAGATFEVVWTGPDNSRDFIALSDPDAAPTANKWITYVYTKRGNPVTLTAPDKPGTYAIQYRTGAQYYVLAQSTVTVAGVAATVAAPDRVGAGEHFEVAWQGPDNSQDFIAIAPQDSAVRQYHHYQYTRKGSPVTLHAPDEPGTYEIRYQTGQSYTILAHQRVIVEPVSATLDGPATVVGGSDFDEIWTGPDHPGDFIAVVAKGADKRSALRGGWSYARRGSPARLRAPLEPGQYEVRYQTGQSAVILTTRPLLVTPPPSPPGHLSVSLARSASGFGPDDAVEIILDASGSMLQKHQGRRRIEIAREVLVNLTGAVIPEGTPFALRVFGHREVDSCRTDLEEPLAPLDSARIDARLAGVQAMHLARTPLARSLQLVAQDLAAVAGQRVVVLVTDGEETCDGDPAAAIESLQASGVDVRINIVGFAIDDAALKSRFRYWADLGGGDYYDADSADALQHSMHQAVQAPYEVRDAAGRVVARGIVGDDGVQLAPGQYHIATRSTPPMQASATVASGKRTGVELR
ncbi:MAG: VWA domain-containing protein [Halioglobus sp.]|nr:VWA domain-containing protein [Halioglobus sp.]